MVMTSPVMAVETWYFVAGYAHAQAEEHLEMIEVLEHVERDGEAIYTLVAHMVEGVEYRLLVEVAAGRMWAAVL